MDFVYRVPAELEPVSDQRIAWRARAFADELDGYLRSNRRRTPANAVRFVLRWADGTERVVVATPDGKLNTYVFDKQTMRGVAASSGEAPRALTLGADPPGESGGLAPLFAATLVADLYAERNPRAAIEQRNTQWALLALAASTGQRPVPESARRAALGLVAKLPSDERETVRTLVRTLYDRELPRRQGMINFSLAGVRPLPGDGKRVRDNDAPLTRKRGVGADDDDDDDDAISASDELNAGDADRASTIVNSLPLLLVERIFDLIGNDPSARAELQRTMRVFSRPFQYESPTRHREAYLDQWPDLARILGDELPAWMSGDVDALPLARLQNTLGAYLKVLIERTGEQGLSLARGATESAAELANRRSAALVAVKRSLALLERLNGRLSVAQLPTTIKDAARVRAARRWSFFRAALRSAAEHPELIRRLPQALAQTNFASLEIRTADELRETRRSDAQSDDRDTYTLEEQDYFVGNFAMWPRTDNQLRSANPVLEGFYYVAAYTAESPIRDAPEGGTVRSDLLVSDTRVPSAQRPQPVVMFTETNLPLELEPRVPYFPLLQIYADGYTRATIAWDDGARLDRSVARVAGVVEWQPGLFWRRVLAYAPADTTMLMTLLRTALPLLQTSGLLSDNSVADALRETVAPSIRDEVDDMLANGEFSSDEEADAVFEAQLRDYVRTAQRDERFDAIVFAVRSDAAFASRLIATIEGDATATFPDRTPTDLGARLLRFLYTRVLLRRTLLPIQRNLSPAIDMSFAAGGAPAAYAEWERRATRELTEYVGQVLLADPLFAGRATTPAQRVDTYDAVAAELEAIERGAVRALGGHEVALSVPLADAHAALRELRATETTVNV